MLEMNRGDHKVATPKLTPTPEPLQEQAVDKAATVERLNFNVSPKVAAETRQLAESLKMSMTELFKYAMSVFKIAVDQERNGRKLVIADKKGRVIREFILPRVD
jgi:hypothetical protein